MPPTPKPEPPKPEPPKPEPQAQKVEETPLPTTAPVPAARPRPEPPKQEEAKPVEKPPEKKPEQKPAEKPQDKKTDTAHAEKPSDKKVADKKQETAKSASSKQSDFNADEIAAQLSKVEAAGGGAKRSQQIASLGGKKNTGGSTLSQSEMDALKGQIQNNWSVISGVDGGKGMIITVTMKLDPSGAIVGRPEVTSSGGNESARRMLEGSAIRAVMRSSPFKNLPADKYDAWSEVVVNFDRANCFERPQYHAETNSHPRHAGHRRMAVMFAAPAQARVEININRGNVEPLPIAITDFISGNELGAQISGVIAADLQRSGLFARSTKPRSSRRSPIRARCRASRTGKRSMPRLW